MASLNEKDEPLRGHFLPDNFVDSGRIINGMFKTRNFVEACVIAAPIALIFWFSLSFLPGNWRGTITLAFAALAFIIGIYGWQEDTVFEFIGHVMKFNKDKRYARYNPRVKREQKPIYLYEDKQKTSMDAIMEKARNMLMGVSDEQYDASDILEQDQKYIVFNEDIELKGSDAPDEVKDKRQLKKEEKERKKREKEVKRIKREQEKRRLLIEQASQEAIRREQKRRNRK